MAALKIYKSGQGYWTRVLTAVGAGALVLSGAAWLYGRLGVIKQNTIYYQVGIPTALVVFFGILIYWLLNRARIVDFMIATEAEMKKVNWPTRRETIGSTWIVICGTAMMAMLLFAVNVLFGWFFLNVVKVLVEPT